MGTIKFFLRGLVTLLLGAILSGCGYLLLLGKTPASQSEKNISALIVAARKNDTVAVRTYIANGEDPSARTSHGWSALSYALDFDNLEMIEELLRAGVDPNATLRTKRHGFNTPMAFGLYSADILRILIKYGVRFEIEPGERYVGSGVLRDAIWIRYKLLKPDWNGIAKPLQQREQNLPKLEENREVISLLIASGACPSRAFPDGSGPSKEKLRSLDDATLNRVIADAESNPSCSRVGKNRQ